MKVCTKCKVQKPLGEFHKDQGKCKPCQIEEKQNRNNKKAQTARPCFVCKTMFVPEKFKSRITCSQECRRKAEHILLSGNPNLGKSYKTSERNKIEIQLIRSLIKKTCGWCAKEYTPLDRAGRSGACSQECRKEIKKASDRERSAKMRRMEQPRNYTCLKCGHYTEGRYLNKKPDYCVPCEKIMITKAKEKRRNASIKRIWIKVARSIRKKRRDIVKRETKPLFRISRKVKRYFALRNIKCQRCSAAINYAKGVTLAIKYCGTCKSEIIKSNKRAERTRRKSLIRARTDRKAQAIDPLKVFDRDKWKCHICGIKTPRKLRGTYEDRAPELDHIVPLAKGGTHTWGNVACACRKCNIAKSDLPLGQIGFSFAV